MGIRDALSAIKDLKAADKELTAVPMGEPGSAETPEFLAANRKVNQAELNPHLPRRYLDPRDR